MTSGTVTPEQRLTALRKLAELKPFQWDCGLPDCDGQPHSSGNPLHAMPHRHARGAQLAPAGDWYAWFVMAGRGYGKTRTGAEWVKRRMMEEPGHRVACIVPDFAVGRDVCVEGESGLLGIAPNPGLFPPAVRRRAKWNRSLGELTLPNGSQLKIFGTTTRKDAEALRGYQCHSAWFEELGTQRFGEVAWDMLAFALRLGSDVRVAITGTPRPTPLIRKLVADDGVVVVHGTTYDNVDNLPVRTLERVRHKYEGTTLGRQELNGELLDNAAGALWSNDLIQHSTGDVPDLARVVVGVDPAGSAHKRSDETGIVVVGVTATGNLWVLDDRSGRYSPEQWRGVVRSAYEDHSADAVIAEKNFGGDLVLSNLRVHGPDETPLPVEAVSASRGKAIRATPIVSLYEQHRVTHAGVLADLETQMTTWVPEGQFDQDGEPIEASTESPDHVDALVWACTALAVRPRRRRATTHFVAA